MTTTSTTSSTQRVPALDGVRALAICLVIAYHGLIAQFPHATGVFATLCGFGWVGVPLFFTLSGFLVAGTIYRQVSVDRFSLGRFYLDRTLRIFPLAYLFLFCYGTVVGRIGWNAWTLTNFTYTSLVTGITEGPGHFWSLQVEELFYLVAPMALILLARFTLTMATMADPKRFAQVLTLAILAQWVVRALWLIVFPYAHGATLEGPYYRPVFNLDFFLAGTLVAVWRQTGALGRVAARVRWTFEKRETATVLLLALYVPLLIATQPMDGLVTRPDWTIALTYPAICVWSAAVVGWFAESSVHVSTDRVATLFASRPASLVATLSYGMYVWHGPTIIFVRVAGLAPVLQVALDLGVFVGVAAISYALVEKPFLLLRDALRAPKVSASRATPSTESFALRPSR